jgi:hypothetical protein
MRPGNLKCGYTDLRHGALLLAIVLLIASAAIVAHPARGQATTQQECPAACELSATWCGNYPSWGGTCSTSTDPTTCAGTTKTILTFTAIPLGGYCIRTASMAGNSTCNATTQSTQNCGPVTQWQCAVVTLNGVTQCASQGSPITVITNYVIYSCTS